jgi:hypothetical protein
MLPCSEVPIRAGNIATMSCTSGTSVPSCRQPHLCVHIKVWPVAPDVVEGVGIGVFLRSRHGGWDRRGPARDPIGCSNSNKSRCRHTALADHLQKQIPVCSAEWGHELSLALHACLGNP